MATAEELLQELERERAARQELEEALQKAAEYGCQLSAQVQEQQQTILEYREKVQSFEETPLVKSQAQSFRRMSQSRRASTVAFGSDTMSKVAFLPGSADSDDEDKKRPGNATQRRGRGGKTMMVEDLMQHNQSLEEDVRRLQQKLEEQEDSDEDSDEGQLRPKRRSRKGLRPDQFEGHNEEEVWVEEDSEVQISNLRQQLQEARKEFAAKQRALEAEVDAKKQEIQEHRQAEQEAKASNSQSVAKLKALQKQCEVLAEENEEAEKQLRMAREKEHELTLQLEEQTLRNEARHSRRWMPTACEEALRGAAGASLADEFQDMEGGEDREDNESEVHEDQSQEGDAAMAKIETLQLELENAKAVATKERQQVEERLATSEAQAAKEIQQLQEKLEAAKAETAAALQQKETLQEHLQAVMAESSKLRKELQVLQECKEVRIGEERSEEEESFWSRVISTIACARTPSKPNTSARHGSPGSPSKESVRLAIPEAAEQASTGNEGGLTDTS